MTTEKIMDRLRKLIRHEESARGIGSLAEAEAFATKIQELLIEHKLEMSTVVVGDDHDAERSEPVEEQMYDPAALDVPYSGRQRVAWMEKLASAVAQGHFCKIIVQPGSFRFWFVGRSTDRLIAGNVFGALVRGAIAACDAEYKKAKRDPWTDSTGFQRSFYLGFAQAIATRLRVTRAAADGTQSTALVLARADGAVTKYMESKKFGSARSGGSGKHHNSSAYASGKAHGSRASINAGITGGGQGRLDK